MFTKESNRGGAIVADVLGSVLTSPRALKTRIWSIIWTSTICLVTILCFPLYQLYHQSIKHYDFGWCYSLQGGANEGIFLKAFDVRGPNSGFSTARGPFHEKGGHSPAMPRSGILTP